MKAFIEFIKYFLYITTSILIVCTIDFLIAENDLISVNTLWQILLSGFLTTAVTILFIPNEKNTKPPGIIQYLLHYAVLCIVMMLCGYRFGWMDFDCQGIIMMAVSVAAVYMITFLSDYMININHANEINRKLKEKYGERG